MKDRELSLLLRDLNDKSVASGGGGAIEPEPIERAEDVAGGNAGNDCKSSGDTLPDRLRL